MDVIRGTARELGVKPSNVLDAIDGTQSDAV